MKKRLIFVLAFAMLLSLFGTAAVADEGKEKEDMKEIGVFDLKKGKVLLNSGYEMPILGIGCFMLSNDQAANSVYWALRDGYRLIDTARIYGNESGVGRGIRRAIDEGFVTREEIFVTTKMWTSGRVSGSAGPGLRRPYDSAPLPAMERCAGLSGHGARCRCGKTPFHRTFQLL